MNTKGTVAMHSPARSARAVGLAVLSCLGLVTTSPSRCIALPLIMNYHGFLTDNASNPVSGPLPMTFKLYNAETGGQGQSPLWTESYASVSVTAGVFNVVLGSTTPLPLSAFTGATLWLQT